MALQELAEICHLFEVFRGNWRDLKGNLGSQLRAIGQTVLLQLAQFAMRFEKTEITKRQLGRLTRQSDQA